jgi:hypothetical protein
MRRLFEMGVVLQYNLRQVTLGPVDLIRYDDREKRGIVNRLINQATEETLVATKSGSFFFASYEIRRAVEIYAEEFCLAVEDTLTAFWAVRRGVPSLALPIWLQNSSADYTTPAIEAAMGEAVAGYLMERIYNARLHHRPRGRSPDIYMILPTGAGATVEAKASVNLKNDMLVSRLADALFGSLTMWAHIDSVQKLEELQRLLCRSWDWPK